MAGCEIGVVGLGTMGAALALNIAEKGFPVAVWNRGPGRVKSLITRAGDLGDRIVPAETPAALVAALRRPRAILLMVPAGPAVDDQIAALRPLLDPGDVILDGGNANFHDTDRRAAAAGDIAILGVGVSGGEEGARHGPSIMAGGPRPAWDRVAPILTAIAARHGGDPCAAWLGQGGAGHFVKTVHNGIEYADMQMIAEAYGLMRDGLGLSAARIAEVFAGWNAGPLRSYLVEITAEVAGTRDAATGGPLLDVIVDAAGQKGTGRWTTIEAQHLAAPVPVIEAAVLARNLSARREERAAGQAAFGPGPRPVAAEALPLDRLERALIAGKVLCYAQGFGMIAAAGTAFGDPLPLPVVARIWRAGCIIRSAMLDDMAAALAENPARSLMLAPRFAGMLRDSHEDLRRVVSLAALRGIAAPALAAGLAYFDAMRTARGTANLIQAQRDFFGLHGFARLDDGGTGQHGPWAGGG